MSAVINASDGFITNIETNNIKVVKELSDLRWSVTKKHPDVELLNSTAGARINTGSKAILADKGFVIGIDTDVWIYKVHSGSVLQIGLAEITRNLGSLAVNSDYVFTQLDVKNDTQIRFYLYVDRLEVEYNKKRTSLYLHMFVGKKLYPWLSGVGAVGYSVSIVRWRFLNLYFDSSGNAVISTVNNNISGAPLIIDAGSSNVSINNSNSGGIKNPLTENLDCGNKSLLNVKYINSLDVNNLNRLKYLSLTPSVIIGSNSWQPEEFKNNHIYKIKQSGVLNVIESDISDGVATIQLYVNDVIIATSNAIELTSSTNKIWIMKTTIIRSNSNMLSISEFKYVGDNSTMFEGTIFKGSASIDFNSVLSFDTRISTVSNIVCDMITITKLNT